MPGGMHVVLSKIRGITDKHLLEAPFVFQCGPLEEISIDYGFSHTDYETVGAGQFSRKGGLQLRAATFDTLFVDFATWARFNNDATEAAGDITPIEDLTAQLIEITESGSPFLLTLAHEFPHVFGKHGKDLGEIAPGALGLANWTLTLAGPELQMPATLRTLRVTEKAGEGDARYTNVAFTEYRDPVVELMRRGGKKHKRSGKRQFPFTVTVMSNNQTVLPNGKKIKDATLAGIAKHVYGEPAGARFIALENGLSDWGFHTSLLLNPRFIHRHKSGSLKPVAGRLIVPAPFDEAVIQR